MSEPTTVGDLDPDAIVLRLSYGRAVHLPDGERCAHLSRGTDTTPKRAATLFDDTPICADCRGEQFRGTDDTDCYLPKTTGVPAND